MTGNIKRKEKSYLNYALIENWKGILQNVNWSFLLWVVELLMVFSSAFLCIFQIAFNKRT